MMAAERVVDRGDYMEIKVADLAEEIVAAIRERMQAEGLSEMASPA